MRSALFLMALTSLPVFAPADAAQAAGSTQDPVLEIVTFRLIDGADAVTFLKAAHGTEKVLRDRGSVVRRYLVQDENGQWTDVIEWTSMTEALSAAEAVMQTPDFAAFGAMIDPNTVEMRHAPILWQME